MFKAPSMVKSVLSFNMASTERFKCLVFYYLLSIDQLCIYRLALTRHDSGQNSLLDFKGLEIKIKLLDPGGTIGTEDDLYNLRFPIRVGS